MNGFQKLCDFFIELQRKSINKVDIFDSLTSLINTFKYVSGKGFLVGKEKDIQSYKTYDEFQKTVTQALTKESINDVIRKNKKNVHLSLSHSQNYAVASVVIE